MHNYMVAAIDDAVLGLCEAEGVPVFPLLANTSRKTPAGEDAWPREGRIAEVKLRVGAPVAS